MGRAPPGRASKVLTLAAVVAAHGIAAPAGGPASSEIKPLWRAPDFGGGAVARESFLRAASQVISPQRRGCPFTARPVGNDRITVAASAECQWRGRGCVRRAHPRLAEGDRCPRRRHSIRRSGYCGAAAPVRVNRTCRCQAPRPTALAPSTWRRTFARPIARGCPCRPCDQGRCPGALPVCRYRGGSVNPVRVLTALRPVFENPPAQAAQAIAFRRPVDARRALFASASRPSSGWGA